MISVLIGFLTVLICILTLIISMNNGLFCTKYSHIQFRAIHYVKQTKKGEIWHSIKYRREFVDYKKKWWQLYKYEPLPDEWLFDSEETKRIWEKINDD